MREIPQHSAQWLKNKIKFLGANDVACLLDSGYNDKDEILHRKINMQQANFSDESQYYIDRGQRYEDIVRDLCARRNKIKIRSVGQKFHPELNFLTASPDGIFGEEKGGATLTEFKVRSHITESVPFKYWIQMQIQMEVWDCNQCLYCDNLIYEYTNRSEFIDDSGCNKPRGILADNGKTYYWKLDSYVEHTIKRDKEWFSKILPDIQRCWQLISVGRSNNGVKRKGKRIGRKRRYSKAFIQPDIEQELVQRRKFLDERPVRITQFDITNWMLKDPLLDWLDHYGPADQTDPPRNRFDLSRYIYNKSINFRNTMRRFMRKRIKAPLSSIDIDRFYRPCQSHKYWIDYENQLMYYDRFSRTMEAMEKGISVIFNAGLYDEQNNLYAKADLLIKIKHLDYLLHTPDVFSDTDGEHYVAVLIKFGTLNLRVDQVYLLSNNKQKIYKGQMAFINRCLTVMQNYDVGKGIIIGRKAEVSQTVKGKPVKQKFNSCFDRVGIVDFESVDIDYPEIVEEAIQWQQRLKSGDQSLSNITLASLMDGSAFNNESLLLPNMKNNRDYPWHNLKQNIATSIGELTLMYRCGVELRNQARAAGITNWRDLNKFKLTKKTKTYINNFIAKNIEDTVNGPGSLEEITTDGPGGVDLLMNIPNVEFFVDFETVNDLGDQFEQFPNSSGISMIYMIGCYCVNWQTGQHFHQSFMVERLNKDEEIRIVKEWIDMMVDFRENYTRNCYIYHWGNAEHDYLNKALIHGNISDSNLFLIDLCKAFKQAYAVVPNTMGYGVKEIAKELKKQGHIETEWPDSTDGGAAMVAAWVAEKICQREGSKFSDLGFMNQISNYNFVDCKVMEEIVNYLRSMDEPDEEI